MKSSLCFLTHLIFCLVCAFAPARTFSAPVHEPLGFFRQPPKYPSNGPLALGPDGYFWGTSFDGGAYGLGCVYKVKADGSEWGVVLSFTGNGTENKGAYPNDGVAFDGAGFAWGSTINGGDSDYGTIFKVKASTGKLSTVVAFASSSTTGSPSSTLVYDGEGSFFGTSSVSNGVGPYGGIFKVNASTGALSSLVLFNQSNGAYPYGSLVSDGAGSYWGTTRQGGTANLGTIFKFNAATGQLTTQASFGGNGSLTKGSYPSSTLALDADGSFWGTTNGGSFDSGTVFKIDKSGVLTTLVEFGGGATIGVSPGNGLVSDGAGYFWGTTLYGGVAGAGTVFKVERTTGKFTTVFEFSDNGATNKGSFAYAPLLNNGTGFLWGTSQYGGATGKGTVFKINIASGDLTTLVEFTDEGFSRKGEFPYTGLVSDGAGFLWGSTQHGGKGNGTLFKIDPVGGAVSTQVEFTDFGGINPGAEPRAQLASDGAGFLWGTTSEGGALGFGTIFKVNISTGVSTTVLEFTGLDGANKGARPNGELVSDGDGSFWGTTYSGGSANNGTIFKINAATGKLVTLIEFTNLPDAQGKGPYAALTPDSNGFFWGTTNRGGPQFPDAGTIYKINKLTGKLTTVVLLTGLSGLNKGTEPRAKLLNDGAGFFWGITSEGGLPGAKRGYGSVFKVNISTGEFSTVVLFNQANGFEPRAGLMSDGAGFFWGTTWLGGTMNQGTIFKVNSLTGVLTTVLNFTGVGSEVNNGSLPGYGSLLRYSDGNFYGTTEGGGPEGGGTIFRLRFGPTPVTAAADGVGKIGALLHATINPNGNSTATRFELSTDPALTGAITLPVAASSPASTAPLPYSRMATGLQPGTTYYYRVVASNVENAIPQRGAILSFTTLPNAVPIVTLLGSSPLIIEAAASYTDAGATAVDADGAAIIPKMTSNTVQANVPGDYSVTWTAVDSFDFTGSAIRTVKVVDTTPPLIVPPAGILVDTLNANGAAVTYPASSASDLVGIQTLTYSHASGSFFPRGDTVVTVTATDAAGNQTTATFTVSVSLSDVVHAAFAQTQDPVPGAGIDSRLPEGAVWLSFGVPAISATGKVAYLGRWKAPSNQSGSGLFIDGVLLAATGEASPVNNAVFQRFKDPVFAQGSDLLVVPAYLAGPGITKANDQVLVSFEPASRIIARKGGATDLGKDVRLANIGAVSATAEGTLFTAKLSGSVPNAEAIFVAKPDGLTSWAHTGQTLLGRQLKSVRLLKVVSGSSGQGRGELSEAGIRFIAAFTDKTQAIIEAAAPGIYKALARSEELVGGAELPAATWKSFGVAVSSSSNGELFTFLATLKSGGGVTMANAQGIFLGAGNQLLARLGAPSPSGASFRTLAEPVLSADGTCLAFTATTKTGGATSPGVFAKSGAEPLATVAGLNIQPPNAPAGVRWKAFTALAAPGGGLGPLFTATLQGPGIKGSNDSGLWVVDTHGTLRSLFREGDLVAGKTLKSFEILKAVAATPSVTRAFNGNSQVVWLATFADGVSAIVSTTIP